MVVSISKKLAKKKAGLLSSVSGHEKHVHILHDFKIREIRVKIFER